MKVINLFAGPGAGKSTLACELFVEMKQTGQSVELVTEYAKDMVYERRDNILADQLYILAKQNRRLDRIRQAGVEWAITDGPLPFGNIYGAGSTVFRAIVWECFRKYDNYNILLKRNPSLEYTGSGRVQQNVAEAMELDNRIANMLDIASEPYIIHEVGITKADDTLVRVGIEVFNRIKKKGTV